MTLTRRHVAAALLGGALLTPLAFTGCASLMGPRTIEIPREELVSKLGERFPATTRLMGVLDVQALRADLTLLPERDQVAMTVPLRTRERLSGQTYNGVLRLNFGLRYEPQDATIRLAAVQVEDVKLEGLPAAAQRSLGRVGAWVAEETLQDYPIHRFKPEDLRKADRLGYEVERVRVTATGLAIQLRPRSSDAPAASPR